MRPYYDRDGITIYHGDASEALGVVGHFDAIVTDPPYGVSLGQNAGSGGGHGLRHDAYNSFGDSYEEFIGKIVPTLTRYIKRAVRAVVFSGPHIHEQMKPDAIGGVFCPAASGRTCWGFKNFLPALLYGTAPDIHLGSRATAISSSECAEKNGHPVPKPLGWMKWAVLLASREGEVVCDPFMGSGTTLVAAALEGRKAIGVEIEERYCEIAAKRLAQGVLPFSGGLDDAEHIAKQAGKSK